jgi:hypothetical protein
VGRADAAVGPLAAPAARLLHAHGPFLVVLAVAAVLRLLAQLAYRPLLWFFGDSFAYLGVARDIGPYDVRPIGYSFFLQVMQPLERLAAVAAVQHALGLAIGVGVYALLLRLGAARWLATLAAAPVLLDAYQLQLEHLLMADTLGLALVALAFWLLLDRPVPTPAVCAWAGLVLALAALTRTVALVLIVPVVAYLIARRVGPVRIGVTVALFALPLHLYSSWFHSEHDVRALSAIDGFFLYGRVSAFAACEGPPPPAPRVEGVLCEIPPPERRRELEFYIWDKRSPAYRLPGTRADANAVLRDFAVETIREQPGDYLRALLADVGSAVGWRRQALPTEFTASNYGFYLRTRGLPESVQLDARGYQGFPEGLTEDEQEALEDEQPIAGNGVTRVDEQLARPLISYQRVAYVPGTLYALAALLALAGVALTGRGRPDDRRRAVCTLFLLSGLAVVAVPIVTQGFDYRYQLPALPMLSIAAALGFSLLRSGPRWLPLRRTADNRASTD